MRFYVYDLVDPRTEDTFYVGKGQRDRLHQHDKDAARGVRSRKCNRIREIWAGGDRVKKIIARRFENESDAYAYEIERIESFGLENLTNVMPGGSGGYVAQAGVAADAAIVRAFVKVYQHTRGGKIKGFWVGPQYLNLIPILAVYQDRAASAVARRGKNWAERLFAAA